MGPLTGGSNTRMTSPEMAENGANTPLFIDKTRASGYK
jgi:predicted secreted protein